MMVLPAAALTSALCMQIKRGVLWLVTASWPSEPSGLCCMI